MSRMKPILIAVSLSVFVISPTFADWREDARAIDISGGENHTLVLTKNKAVWACGPNGDSASGYFGVLGTSSTDPDLIAKTLISVLGGDMGTEYLQDINDVDAGWKHSLALDVNDFVWAWGWNSEGQLGDNQDNYYQATPVQVLRGEQTPADPNDPNLARIIHISAGRSGEFSLAADANGYAYAWGMNQEGQLGNNELGEDERELTPVFVLRGEQQPEDPCNPDPNLTRIVAVSAGADHSMALEKLDPDDPNLNGCVYTWGNNRWPGDGENYQSGLGKLGNGTDDPCRPMPVRVLSGHQHPNDPNQPFLNHIVAVSAGWNHCMALEKDDPFDPNMFNPTYKGRVYTWGSNGQGYGDGQDPCSIGGRLGDGTYNDSNTPVLVLSGEQDPNNNEPNSYLEHIIAISAGEAHSMALDVNRYVYCWGDNYHGQLGNDSNVASTTPVRVANPDDPNLPLENIVAISAGHWHSIAVDSDGVIWTWGKTGEGRLGLADMGTVESEPNCSIPHRVPPVFNETQETFRFGIQDAIDEANDNDLLVASEGIYYENVDFKSKSITLESEDPEDPKVVADTIIDAIYNKGKTGEPQSNYSAVYLYGTSGAGLAGFTLIDANECGVVCINTDSVYISDCVIQDNGGDGIYVRNSSVDIRGCEIRDNCSRSDAHYCGIYTKQDSDVNVVNCVIADNNDGGIYCDASSLRVTISAIQNNKYRGIYESNSTVAAVIANNIIRSNADDGICFYSEELSSGPKIANNWIYDNGGSGIKTNNLIYQPDPIAAIVNNTIVGNDEYGVESNYATDVSITNCIIWDNGDDPNDDNLYADNGTFDVTYSCMQGDYAGTGGNIDSDPCFVDVDANNFHLDANSLCIDAGDPNFGPDPNETDIDGEDRIVDGDANGTEIVDMGADEFYWSAADYSGDGIVNFIDYAILTAYWQDTGIDYNDVFAFGDSNSVSLEEFCDVWLWEAGYLRGPMPLMAGRSGKGMVEGLRLEVGLSALAAAEREPRIGDAVDVEELLDWLAEIWLDPEVRKTLDADVWLKLYESLKDGK